MRMHGQGKKTIINGALILLFTTEYEQEGKRVLLISVGHFVIITDKFDNKI